MISSEQAGLGTKLATPVVYAIVFVLTAFLSITVLFEYDFSSLPLIVFWALPMLLFALSFGVFGWGLLLLERLRRPTVLDHLRRCALLYVTLIPIASVLLLAIHSGNADAGYAIVLAVVLSAIYAIFVDALILFVARLRSGRTNPRGER